MKKLPEHLRYTYADGFRDFKAKKRGQVKRAIAALEDVAFASAFMPAETHALLIQAISAMGEVQRLVSQKQWGR